MTVITSAYDELAPAPTLDEMMKDPTLIPSRIKQQIENLDHEGLFFRQGPPNQGVVAFQEAQAEDYGDDNIEEIAEFGEIPVDSPDIDEEARRVAYSIKTGRGFRVSWEQRNENRIDAVNRSMQDLVRKVRLHSVNTIRTAFTRANVPELQADTPWAEGGNVIQDIIDAINTVQGATDDTDPNLRFDYDPDTILMHPLTMTQMLLSEQIQKFYIGNMASENPVFKGLTTTQIAGQLQVAKSKLILPGEVYVFERGTTGFISEQLPLTVTDLLPEAGGDPTIGGRTMSWRSDIVRKRAIAIDNPKAIVKLTGVA